MPAGLQLLWPVLVHRLTTAMTNLLGRPVGAGAPTLLPAGRCPQRLAFAVVVECEWFGKPVVIALDEPLARAVVDALETDLLAPRGTGGLTEVEHGLLEFAAIAVADLLCRGAVDSACRPRIVGLRSGGDLRRLQGGEVCDSMTWIDSTLQVGLMPGRLVVGFADWNPSTQIEPDTLPEPKEVAAAQVAVRVALPSFRLSAGEVDAMAPGDIVLPGVGNLLAVGESLRLVTETGWELADAQVSLDSPTVMRVLVGRLGLRAWSGAGAESSDRVWALMGSTVLTPHSATRLTAGASLELARCAGDVTVWRQGRPTWRAERVQVEGELGLRLLARVPA